MVSCCWAYCPFHSYRKQQLHHCYLLYVLTFYIRDTELTPAAEIRDDLNQCGITLIRLQIPFWLLVTFGAYSLSSLGLGLLRFRDCPEAYESLLAEISQAKDELRDKGVSVD